MRMVPLNLNMQGDIGLFTDQMFKPIQEPVRWLMRPKLDQHLFVLLFSCIVNVELVYVQVCLPVQLVFHYGLWLWNQKPCSSAYQETKRALTRTSHVLIKTHSTIYSMCSVQYSTVQ